MKRALVTGGGGFVGAALSRTLLAHGVDVVIVGRNNHPELEKAGAVLVKGDIRSAEVVNRAASGCDTIFHMAAKAGIWGPWEEYYSINVIGTANVLAACRTHRISNLVYTSTPSVVFNRADIVGCDETLPYGRRYLCHYAHTKAVAEKMVLAVNSASLRTVALRPHLVWGPGDTNLIPRLLDRGRRRLLKQVGDGNNLVDISYIDNVVDAHLRAAENLEQEATAAGRAYFISQGEPVNLWAWINDLFGMLDIPPVTEKISFRKAYFAGAVMEGIYKTFGIQNEPLMTRFLAEQLAKSHWFSIERAKRDLEYQPKVSTAEGLTALVKWLAGRK